MKNKKFIFSMLLVAIVAGTGLAGTYAYFTAIRTTNANTFTTGTLDLDVASGGVAIDPFVISNIGENGDISGTKTWDITNTGSLPGRLLVRVTDLANAENSCNDQETSTEPACADDNLGELGAVIDLTLDHGATQVLPAATDVVNSTLATANEASIGTDWRDLYYATNGGIILQAGESTTVTAHWATGEAGYGNEVQSDSVSFNMDFRLIQQVTNNVAN